MTEGRSMGEDEGEDKVKTVATVMATFPKVVIGVGWSYLKMKRQANKCSRQLERTMVEQGMPREYASRLADRYAKEISVRDLISQMDLPGIRIKVHDE